MPFYVRLGPHGLIIAIGAVLHARLGRVIYRRKNRQKLRMRLDSSGQPGRNWMVDGPENLTPPARSVHIIRSAPERHPLREVSHQE